MGSLRVRHDWATSFSLFTFMHWRRKWQPTPVFLLGEIPGILHPRDGAWWAAIYGVAQSRTRLKQLSSTPLANVRLSDSSWRRDKKLFSAVYVYKMYLLNLLPNYWFWLCPWWTSWKASYCSLNGWHGMVLLQTNVRKLLNKLLEHGFLLTLSLPRS